MAVEQLQNCCYLIRLPVLVQLLVRQLLVFLLPPLLHPVLALLVVLPIIHEGVDLQLDLPLLIFLPLEEIWRFDFWFLYYGDHV